MRLNVDTRSLAPVLLVFAVLVSMAGLAPAPARADGPPPPQSQQVFAFGWNAGDAAADFDGTEHVGFGPGANGMATAAALTEGTIQVNFTPSSVAGTQTLAHLFSSANPDDGAVLSLEGSALRWRVRAGGSTLEDRTVPVALVPGSAHQVHVVVAHGYLWIHLDASPVYFGSSTAFLAAIPGMDSIHVGGRALAGGAWTDHFTGTLQRITITDGRITPAEMQGIVPDNVAINRFPVALADHAALRAHLEPGKAEPSTWVFTGDSITHGALWTFGYRSWSEHAAARFAELGNGEDVVVNTAISGDTAGAGSGTIGINDTFEERAGRYDADVVVTMIGMNDAATSTGQSIQMYRDNLAAIVTKSRADGAIPVFATSNPVQGGVAGTNRAQYPAYVQAMREVAAQHQVVVVDNYADWLYLNSGEAPALWYGDTIHPSARGHWEFARNFFETFGAWDTASGVGSETDVPRSGLIPGSGPALNHPVQQTFGFGFTGAWDGTRVEDRSADLSLANPLHRQVEGTYLTRFQTGSSAEQLLFVIHDSTRDDSYFKVVTAGGGVRVEVSNRGTELLALASPDMDLDDNAVHSVAVVAGNGSTRLFVDGLAVAVAPRQVFGADVPAIDAFHVGGLPSDDGVVDGFVGTLARVWAWARPAEPFNFLVERASVAPEPEFVNSFLGFGSNVAESWPLLVLGEQEQLNSPDHGWRTWPQIVTERNRWERGHRRDYVVTATPGAATLAERVAWLQQRPSLASSRLVLLPLVVADIVGAGGDDAYAAQLTDAIAAVRALGRTPILLTDPAAEVAAPGANDLVRRIAADHNAFVIDVAAEMRATNSGTVPSTWFNAGELSAFGHHRVAFKVMKDLGIWGVDSNSANSQPRPATSLALTAPAEATGPAGGTVEFDVALAMATNPGDDPAFSAHVLGAEAAIAGLSIGSTEGTVSGAHGAVSLPGTALGSQATATVRVDIPADAVAGDEIRVVVNGSAANQKAQVAPKVVTITVEAAVEPTPTATPSVTSTPTPEPTVTVTVTPTVTATPTTTVTPTVTVTPTATVTPTVTVTPTATITPTVTVTPTATITVTAPPSQQPTQPTTPPATPGPQVDVYSTSGLHFVGGRHWYTACEPYSQTIRCTTEIWATQTRLVDGAYRSTTGWVFNNLTYLPEMTRAQWGTNPLANDGEWTSAGRRWRTECDTPATGTGACRSYIWASYVAAQQQADGTWRFQPTQGWVVNNIVRFKA